jgi:hypothetical protein
VPATTIRSRARALAPEIAERRQEAQGVGLDPLLAHARNIPGFGGFVLDRDGQPTVYLKDARLDAIDFNG